MKELLVRFERVKPLILSVLGLNLLSLVFFILRVVDSGNYRYWFLLWNVFLAWIPLVMAAWLVTNLRKQSWLSMKAGLITILWLLFLPNSFYVLSDFIHLHETGEVSVLYDVVFFFSCTINSFIVGYMSIYWLHKELLKRVKRRDAHTVIGGVFLVCGFAIYLGRFLRWNSWDIFLRPAGIIFDISGSLINPIARPDFLTTTLSFFLLLSSVYAVIWQLVKYLKGDHQKV